MKTQIMIAALAMGAGTAAFAGTVAEWKFVESPAKSGTIAERSGNGLDLTVSGDAERWKFEKVDNKGTLTLKGSHEWTEGGQFLIQSKIPLDKFEPANGFTFEMFFTPGEDFKNESTLTLFTNMPYGTKPGFDSRMRFSMLELISGKDHPEFTPEGSEGWSGSTVSSGGLLPFLPGVWYHVALVYDGKRASIYLDGLKVAESQDDFVVTPGGEDYFIGSFHGGSCHGFVGSIAWAKLSDKALSDEAIMKSAKFIADK